MKQIIRTLSWEKDKLEIIDQTRLPENEEYIKLCTVEDVFEAIRTLKIRGAPAIGIAAAYGILLAAKKAKIKDKKNFFEILEKSSQYMNSCRPTAYNLFYAVKRLNDIALKNSHLLVKEIIRRMELECQKIFNEDIQSSISIARYGNTLIKSGMRILTHCNAGALATSGIGTALAPVYLAARKHKRIEVFVDETRPVLQGARLTMWELKKANIKCTLICDNMAGFLMQQKRIDMVITGADRIASNGDTANKIGTYSIAVLAKFHRIPFYIAAPLSSFDFSKPSGDRIPVEQRDRKEITCIKGVSIAPENINVYNPSFDITPGRLITGFITEKGIFACEEIHMLAKTEQY